MGTLLLSFDFVHTKIVADIADVQYVVTVIVCGGKNLAVSSSLFGQLVALYELSTTV